MIDLETSEQKKSMAMRLSFETSIILCVQYLLFYGVVLIFSLKSGLNAFDNVKLEFMIIFGETLKPSCNLYITHLAQFFMVLQLFFYTPFIYYIAKEHLLVSLDEIINRSVSRMIDRVKTQTLGDPRFFLAECETQNYVHKVRVSMDESNTPQRAMTTKQLLDSYE